MHTPVIFRPKGLDRKFVRHSGMIFFCFYILAQLVFIDDGVDRVIFTVFCVLFLAFAYGLYRTQGVQWPQEIRLSEAGLSYASIQDRYGIDHVPWQEIGEIKVFHNQFRTGEFICLGLRPGDFRDGVLLHQSQAINFGLDINVPVSVDATTGEVFGLVQEFWLKYRG